MDELLAQFLIEAPELIARAGDDLAQLARDPADRACIDSAFRAIHTLKGSVAFFDMAPLGRALHAAEDVLEHVRAGRRTLDPGGLAALVAVLDETDRGVEAMEQAGALPADAAAIADRLIALIAGGAVAATDAARMHAPVSGWLAALQAREAGRIEAAAADLVAFRYSPDADCFFRGDDPLALAAAVPGLVALAMFPTEPWPPLDRFEPFRCTLVIEGLSRASPDAVRAPFRMVADQLELVELAAEMPSAGNEDDANAGAASRAVLRVDAVRVDALADSVGQLVVASNMLSHVVQEATRAAPQAGARIRAAQTELERAVSDMRRAVTAVRMVSLAPTLRRVPRLVREVAAALGKPVRLEMSGETTEVDKAVADALYEPLIHLVRNALDHGIESTEARRAAGKPEIGTLRLQVRRDGNTVVIALSDDGAGIDAARVRDLAVARGIVDRDAADGMDDAHAIRLVFAAGFSTAATVSAVSGRGVGLDAVQAAAERLGGTIDVASGPGAGTSMRLRLPLNAILTRLLVVRVGDDRYAIPLDRIVETTIVPRARILAVGGGKACVIRDRTLPVLSLAALLGGEAASQPQARMLVTEAAGEPVGVVVDGFEARIDGLVRPRGGLLAGVPGVAGTTLLGDGGVLLVLDIGELVA